MLLYNNIIKVPVITDEDGLHVLEGWMLTIVPEEHDEEPLRYFCGFKDNNLKSVFAVFRDIMNRQAKEVTDPMFLIPEAKNVEEERERIRKAAEE